jgi:hypothetical protein
VQAAEGSKVGFKCGSTVSLPLTSHLRNSRVLSKLGSTESTLETMVLTHPPQDFLEDLLLPIVIVIATVRWVTFQEAKQVGKCRRRLEGALPSGSIKDRYSPSGCPRRDRDDGGEGRGSRHYRVQRR